MGLRTMRDMVKKNSTKNIVFDRSMSLRFTSNIGTVPIQAFQDVPYFKIQPRTNYKLEELNGEWGVSDDPADEAITVLLGVYEHGATFVATDAGIFANENYWESTIHYRAVGTPANVLNTLNYVEKTWQDSDGEIYRDRYDIVSTNMDFGFLVFGSGVISLFRHFRLRWIETYNQRSFTDPPGEWSGYTDEEVWGNQ